MIVDYIVYMTYNPPGKWEVHNQWSREGCDTGNCLCNQVKLSETKQWNNEDAGVSPCKFTTTRLESQTTPGRCTGTAEYVTDTEIKKIIVGGPGAKRESCVVMHFLDPSSSSDILVYDNN
ncbi:hypothetical protein MFIFM68171_02758 [Madurella fahalii]|uniref:Uncharacterized protein n=1 Tax=Madurella fahalii TaxID=1157608 RepID=A0ABQ0G452_9PEZI